jgi:hypothetical protein
VRAESEAWQAVCEPVVLPRSTVHKESVWEGKYGEIEPNGGASKVMKTWGISCDGMLHPKVLPPHINSPTMLLGY